METSKANLNSTSKRLQTKDIFGELHWIDCIYGQPEPGGCDYVKDCECWYEEEEAELLLRINKIYKGANNMSELLDKLKDDIRDYKKKGDTSKILTDEEARQHQDLIKNLENMTAYFDKILSGYKL